MLTKVMMETDCPPSPFTTEKMGMCLKGLVGMGIRGSTLREFLLLRTVKLGNDISYQGVTNSYGANQPLNVREADCLVKTKFILPLTRGRRVYCQIYCWWSTN